MVCNKYYYRKIKLHIISFEMLIYDYLDTCRASLNLVEKTWLRSKRFNEKWQQKYIASLKETPEQYI